MLLSIYTGCKRPGGIWMCAYVGCRRPGRMWLKKEAFLEELGSRNWQIVGPKARYVGWLKIGLITSSDHPTLCSVLRL
jgi:hypothetical protein